MSTGISIIFLSTKRQHVVSDYDVSMCNVLVVSWLQTSKSWSAFILRFNSDQERSCMNALLDWGSVGTDGDWRFKRHVRFADLIWFENHMWRAHCCLYNQAIDTSDGYMLPAGHHEGYLLSPRASLRRLVGNLEFDICILVCAHIIPKIIGFWIMWCM